MIFLYEHFFLFRFFTILWYENDFMRARCARVWVFVDCMSVCRFFFVKFFLRVVRSWRRTDGKIAVRQNEMMKIGSASCSFPIVVGFAILFFFLIFFSMTSRESNVIGGGMFFFERGKKWEAFRLGGFSEKEGDFLNLV